MPDNKEKSLGLLIETYKLYAAFCAIIIAGLLSFASSLNNANNILCLYFAIGALSLSSIFCILGIQNFISQVYNGKFEIYSPGAKLITISIMTFLFLGLGLGFFFLIKQDKLSPQNKLNKIEYTTHGHTSSSFE